nr:class B sortase [Lachnospiraceae bacterium]
MKKTLAVTAVTVSFLILAALLAVGFYHRKDRTERGERLFGKQDGALETAGYPDGNQETAGYPADEELLNEGSLNDEILNEDAGTTNEAGGGNLNDGAGTGNINGGGNEELSAIENETGSETVSIDDSNPDNSKEPLPKYKELLQINPYVAGWLKIDDTVIDEPVVYTPKSQNYFLHRDIEGNEAERGSLFIAVNWYDGSGNTLIYGHNMKDGSGFGALGKYAKESYGRSHSVIRFDTLYE